MEAERPYDLAERALNPQHPPFSFNDFRRNACEPPPIGLSLTAVLRQIEGEDAFQVFGALQHLPVV
jgi:hypothetical protein